jgi:hypothetical protein
MQNDYHHRPSAVQAHSFVVRIWWEPGLTRPDGSPLWRGQVQHAASGRSQVFQSLTEMEGFIQDQTGDLGTDKASIVDDRASNEEQR